MQYSFYNCREKYTIFNMSLKIRFYELLNGVVEAKNNKNTLYITNEKYNVLLNEVKESKLVKVKKSIHYRRLKRFDIVNIGGEEKLIVPMNGASEEMRYYVRYDDLYEIIHEAHIATGHGGRNRIVYAVNSKYKNVNIEAINIYLKLCEPCQKKHSMPKKGLTVKPIIHTEMNSRCQVDLIDMQANPDNNYKFIMVYQDHLTKFVILRPLKFKRAEEVAYNLLDIFTLFGAPNILHSDNGREFVNAVITNLCSLWSEVKIVHGKARHSQSQGSVERANQDIESMIATWMETNKTTKWSESLRFVQAMKNGAFHSGTYYTKIGI